MEGDLEKRKEDLLNKLNEKKYIQYILLAIVAYFGYYIRTLNLPLLQGKYPLALDPYAFLKYVRYILEHGQLMEIDFMRFYPHGFVNVSEFRVLSYAIAYFYKILHFFNSAITVEQAHIIYPVVAFVIGLIFFFLLLKKIFNWKVAIVASAFLTVLPAYLYRTMAGFSDKEAFALMCFYAALYFFISAFKSKDSKWKYIVNAALAGIITGIMAVVWGGVSFMYLIVGMFIVIIMLLNQIEKKDFLIFVVWFVFFLGIASICYPERYGILFFYQTIRMMSTNLILLVSFAWAGVTLLYKKNFFKIKDRFKNHLPDSIASLMLLIGIGIIAILVIKPSYFVTLISTFKNALLGTAPDRWTLTVAESHQPYFSDIIGQFHWKAIIIFFVGSLLLFYEAFKNVLKNKTIIVTAVFGLLLIGIGLSRYSPSSPTFNGDTQMAQLVFFGSLLGIAAMLSYGIYWFYKNKREAYNSLKEVDKGYILILVWFLVMILASRIAIRLMVAFAPVTAVLLAYTFVKGIEYSAKLKQDYLKIIAWIIIIVIVGSLFINYSKNVMNQARHTGPSFNSQWQSAMGWVSANTPEDAVFAHWWDYGYWVQTEGHRTTLSDGGNAYGHINHFVGRHILTAQSNTEALEFLKAKNVSYLLMISDEIGKYPAFSSIGADENYDRYSWITAFTLDRNRISETRNSTIYSYSGGTPLDDDFIYQGRLFPSGAAGIGGFFLPVSMIDVPGPNGTTQKAEKIGQPQAVIFHNGLQENVPLKCIYINGQKIMFEGENMLEGCLRVMPTFRSDRNNDPIGAALYLSPDVTKSLFARLFLMNEQSPYFKQVYSDEQNSPVALYDGRQIGPLKIWQVTYPDNLTIPEYYYGISLPNPNVTKVRR